MTFISSIDIGNFATEEMSEKGKNVPACGAQCHESDDVFCLIVSVKIDVVVSIPVQIDQTIIKFHTYKKELIMVLCPIFSSFLPFHYSRFLLTELLLELSFG
jgi:hypothetical protein